MDFTLCYFINFQISDPSVTDIWAIEAYVLTLINNMQLYILQIPKPDAYIYYLSHNHMHRLYIRRYAWSKAPDGLIYGTNTTQRVKSHPGLVKHWIKAALSLSDGTASKDNPTYLWGTLSRIQVHCFFLFLLLLLKALFLIFKGNLAHFVLQNWLGLSHDLYKVLQSNTTLTLDEVWSVWVWDHKCSQLTVWLCRQEVWEM